MISSSIRNSPRLDILLRSSCEDAYLRPFFERFSSSSAKSRRVWWPGWWFVGIRRATTGTLIRQSMGAVGNAVLPGLASLNVSLSLELQCWSVASVSTKVIRLEWTRYPDRIWNDKTMTMNDETVTIPAKHPCYGLAAEKASPTRATQRSLLT